ncbi:dienelactone hydrolase family protein [Anaerorhabdus sp.]|jgi:dienelactone hydrolase|uniref:dienelactone hydrolase family protein n=1 Tax=Anaerorhabdus sp. TaxID=1872524 RepID=UPI002FCB0BBB
MEQIKKDAVILLHEIYGVNEFIEKKKRELELLGFDVYVPNLLERPAFSYEQKEVAYDFFMNRVGFDKDKQVLYLTTKLKRHYNKVIVIGFSVGATIAYKCSESDLVDGVICCYGSRIRDYADINPQCPTLVILSNDDTEVILNQIKEKSNIEILLFDSKHGFIDEYSTAYNEIDSNLAMKAIVTFIENKILK